MHQLFHYSSPPTEYIDYPTMFKSVAIVQFMLILVDRLISSHSNQKTIRSSYEYLMPPTQKIFHLGGQQKHPTKRPSRPCRYQPTPPFYIKLNQKKRFPLPETNMPKKNTKKKRKGVSKGKKITHPAIRFPF